MLIQQGAVAGTLVSVSRVLFSMGFDLGGFGLTLQREVDAAHAFT